MIHKLIVTKTFEDFVRGDIITDPAEILRIIESDHIQFVRPVVMPALAKD